MTLPLPFPTLSPTPDPDEYQANFEAIAKQFPLSRKSMSLEDAHVVGAAGEPAFQNSWVNFDTTLWQGARFWKDPLDVVHLEGLIKSGTVPGHAFTLPAGYRPSNNHLFITVANAAVGVIAVYTSGAVEVNSGSNAWVSLSGITFRREQ